MLRKEILNALAESIGTIGTHDTHLLNKINESADKLEQVVIKDNWAKSLKSHHFEYKLY